jgi:quercetin dioxygenase-like cupin family protein
MYVAAAGTLPESPIPGIRHRTLARQGDGLETMSIWSQTIEPGQATPPHRHECEEMVVVVSGSGTLRAGGISHAFKAGDTLVLPANDDHQIVNSGSVPLALVAAFSASPVATFLPDGTALELPWAS